MSEFVKCEQNCNNDAVVYAGDRIYDGWAGFYCVNCAEYLGFRVMDKFPNGIKEKK